MAQAALGDRTRFRKWIDIVENQHQESAPGYAFSDVFYPFMEETIFPKMEEKDIEQLKFDIAASLQQWTEDLFKELVKLGLSKYESKNIFLRVFEQPDSMRAQKLNDIKNLNISLNNGPIELSDRSLQVSSTIE